MSHSTSALKFYRICCYALAGGAILQNALGLFLRHIWGPQQKDWEPFVLLLFFGLLLTIPVALLASIVVTIRTRQHLDCLAATVAAAILFILPWWLFD